jgi:hypothetical protein
MRLSGLNHAQSKEIYNCKFTGASCASKLVVAWQVRHCAATLLFVLLSSGFTREIGSELADERAIFLSG